MADYTAYAGQKIRVVFYEHTYLGWQYGYKTHRTTRLVNRYGTLADLVTAEGVVSLTAARTVYNGYEYTYTQEILDAASANVIDSATYVSFSTLETYSGNRQQEQWYNYQVYQYTYDFNISPSATPGTYYLLWTKTQYTPQQLQTDWESPDVYDLTFDGSVTKSVEILASAVIDPPEKAVLVSPAPTGVTDVDGDAGLEWLDGGLGAANAATGFNLYFADSLAGLAKIGNSRGATEVTSTSAVANGGNYSAGSTYYWRVDAFNAGGLTTGDVWTFVVFSLEFPEWRPPLYDEDDLTLSAGGGGRYKQSFVAVGHRKIYFGDM